MIDLIPAGKEHLETLIEHAAMRSALQQADTPQLSNQIAENEFWRESLTGLIEIGSGMIAMESDEIVGSMLIIPCDAPFFGKLPGFFVPEYGWSAFGTRRLYVLEKLYTQLCQLSLEKRWMNQLIAVPAYDIGARQLLHDLGFANQVINAIASIEFTSLRKMSAASEIILRPGDEDDSEMIRTLKIKLAQHLSASPTMLYLDINRMDNWLADWLTQPGDVSIVAEYNGRLIGYLQAGNPRWDVSRMVHTDDDLAIFGAYLDEEHRGKGIFDAMLGKLCEIGKSMEKKRLSVDFESSNPTARRYWLRHFSPITYAMLRKVDERVFESPS